MLWGILPTGLTHPILLDEITELKHDLLSRQDGLLLPNWEGILSGLDGSIHLVLSGTGYSAEDLICGWVIVVDPPVCLRLYKLPIDNQWH